MFLIEEPTPAQIARFCRDGFLIVERLIEPDAAARLASRFAPLFRGEFETGLYPDEWNWREGRDAGSLTRQICNAWKSDRAVARAVLHPRIGLWCARLRGWPGARINQDNVLWKPPEARPLAFHQDDSYQQWVVPPEMCTCWIALDETSASGGTIEYVVGSHRWGLAPPASQFHAPADYEREMREAAERAGAVPEVVRVEVPAGGGGVPPRAHLPRLGHQPRRSTSPGGGVPLHVFEGALPLHQRRIRLRTIQACRQHGDGRVLLPRAVDGGRLPQCISGRGSCAAAVDAMIALGRSGSETKPQTRWLENLPAMGKGHSCDRGFSSRYSRSYFVALPRAFSGGYLSSLRAILRRTAASRSTPTLSASLRR